MCTDNNVLFMSEGMMERETDRRISAAAVVMRSLYRSVMVKRELSRKQFAISTPDHTSF